MKISKSKWLEYANTLAKLDKKATDLVTKYFTAHPDIDRKTLIGYCYAISEKYGNAAAALSAEYCDLIAAASNIGTKAVPAEPATIAEVAQAVNASLSRSKRADMVGASVGAIVKRTGANTVLQHARRTHAEWAWIPSGDTCAFCLTLASRGWQTLTGDTTDHAEHIHTNCNCAFGIRYNARTKYAGYDPEKYLSAYDAAPGATPKEKINAMRRQGYRENADKINEQKRAAYALRQAEKHREATP